MVVEVTQKHHAVDENNMVNSSFLKISHDFGITTEQISSAIGLSRSSIYRGIKADSKPGELALLLIRCYRILYSSSKKNKLPIKRWFTTFNSELGGIPAEQITSLSGLIKISNYLENDVAIPKQHIDLQSHN